MFAALFESETFKKLNISFKPKENSISQDTGWETREKYLEAGYKGTILEMKNTRIFKDGSFREVICAEYYLPGFHNIFASHFGRGSTLGANKYMRGCGIFYKLPVLGKYLRRKKGLIEKEKWIDICKKIISSQI